MVDFMPFWPTTCNSSTSVNFLKCRRFAKAVSTRQNFLTKNRSKMEKNVIVELFFRPGARGKWVEIANACEGLVGPAPSEPIGPSRALDSTNTLNLSAPQGVKSTPTDTTLTSLSLIFFKSRPSADTSDP